ncbi:MAG: hypothetical protein ACUVT7_03210 [Thermoplasmata archaeon]
MKCKYLTKDNMCTGKYSGYSCIKKQCSIYREAQKCEYHEISGDYCRKYGRFGCVGKDSCQTLADYLETVAEEEQA